MWELSLKHHQGKLPALSGAITDRPGFLQADGFEALPIALAHGLLTADPQLSTFPYRTLW